jgi:hypothetical protein
MLQKGSLPRLPAMLNAASSAGATGTQLLASVMTGGRHEYRWRWPLEQARCTRTPTWSEALELVPGAAFFLSTGMREARC